MLEIYFVGGNGKITEYASTLKVFFCFLSFSVIYCMVSSCCLHKLEVCAPLTHDAQLLEVYSGAHHKIFSSIKINLHDIVEELH